MISMSKISKLRTLTGCKVKNIIRVLTICCIFTIILFLFDCSVKSRHSIFCIPQHVVRHRCNDPLSFWFFEICFAFNRVEAVCSFGFASHIQICIIEINKSREKGRHAANGKYPVKLVSLARQVRGEGNGEMRTVRKKGAGRQAGTGAAVGKIDLRRAE